MLATGTPRRLSEIQYLRALAALSVVVFHASYYLEMVRGEASYHAFFGTNLGKFGVTLFFAISGYLMARIAGAATPGRFLVHRVLRIYPIYWVTAGTVLLIINNTGQDVPLDPSTFTLLPGLHWRSQSILSVEWTLPFELFFYAVVFLAIALGAGARLHLLAAAWLPLILLARLTLSGQGPEALFPNLPSLSMLPVSEKCLGFVLGLMIPAALRRARAGAGCLVVGTGLVLAAGAVPPLLEWVLAAGCALLVATAAAAEARHPEVTSLARLGDWSFALYLVHVPVVLLVLKTLPAYCPPQAAWMAAIGAALAASAALGKLDIRLYDGLKAWADAAPRWTRRAIILAFLAVFLGGGAFWDLRGRYDRHVRAPAGEIGARIEAQAAALPSAASPSASLLERAVAAGLRESPDLLGYLDLINRHRVDGWAIDRAGADPAPAVLVFADGRLLARATPAYPRYDVAAALGLAGGSRLGFAQGITGFDCRPEIRVEGLIVSGDRVARLQLPEPLPRCPANL
jgi:peptidoglycan/LPS O-acetylase OafA/YrhL